MDLNERICADFINAYKEKNVLKKNFLSVIKGEIQNLKGKNIEITDESVMSILTKMEKSLKLMNNDESKLELEYLKVYLPNRLNEDEIRNIVLNLKSDGITSIGAIMKEFNLNYKGLVDNSIVSRIINES